MKIKQLLSLVLVGTLMFASLASAGLLDHKVSSVLMGNATTDSGEILMIKGAQTGDPQVTHALSSDANGDFSTTTDTGDITLASADDIYLTPTGGEVIAGGNIDIGAHYQDFGEISTPSAPADNVGRLYSKDSSGISAPYWEDKDGTESAILTTSTPLVSWVGVTTLAYDGDGLAGYHGAGSSDAQCATDTSDASARVCTNEEMVALIQQGSTFGGLTDEVWANGGAPGYTANANDCKAWSEDAAGYYGRYWKLTDKAGWMSGCASAKKFACCKL